MKRGGERREKEGRYGKDRRERKREYGWIERRDGKSEGDTQRNEKWCEREKEGRMEGKREREQGEVGLLLPAVLVSISKEKTLCVCK